MKIHIEIEVDIDYDLQPYEPPTETYDCFLPGCDEEITINSVSVGKTDILAELPKDVKEKILYDCAENAQWCRNR